MHANAHLNTAVAEKLVRDLTPEVIMLHGDHCRVRHPVDEDEKRRFLFKKIAEERMKYIEAPAERKLEELADIGEAILATGEFIKVRSDELTELGPRHVLWSRFGVTRAIMAEVPVFVGQGSARNLVLRFDILRNKLPCIDRTLMSGYLASMFEIVSALAHIHGTSEAVLAKYMENKRRERGGFEKFLIMEIQ